MSDLLREMDALRARLARQRSAARRAERADDPADGGGAPLRPSRKITNPEAGMTWADARAWCGDDIDPVTKRAARERGIGYASLGLDEVERRREQLLPEIAKLRKSDRIPEALAVEVFAVSTADVFLWFAYDGDDVSPQPSDEEAC